MPLLAFVWAGTLFLQSAASRSGPTTLSSQSSNGPSASHAAGLAKRPMGHVMRADTTGNRSEISAVPKAMPFLSAEHKVSSKAATAKGQAIVYFLFMVNNALPHADVWEMFFADAPKDHWRAIVHCQDANGCKKTGLLKALPNFQMIRTEKSWYCHDLVTAMTHMLKSALELDAVPAPPGDTSKFVFISDSTLPVKPFKEVYSQLTSNGDSDFCVFPADQWASAKIDGHAVSMVKHHQWVTLNRVHAEKMVKDWVPVDYRGVWQVPLRGGSWTGKERHLSPQHFFHPAYSNWCTDEWAFFATLFGAVEPQNGLRSFAGLSGPPLHMWGPNSLNTQGVCRTFSFWGWDNGPDFATLGSRINSDSQNSKMSCYPKCYQHPASFEYLSDVSLQALRQSPFLFARKFNNNVYMPNYYGLVLADTPIALVAANATMKNSNASTVTFPNSTRQY